MNYMQRGNYVVVVNPLSYSALITSDRDLAWGVFDTKTHQFFSVSKNADPDELHRLIRAEASLFHQDVPRLYHRPFHRSPDSRHYVHFARQLLSEFL